MDDFSKQKIAEDRYAKMKGLPVEEYKGDFNKPHYHNIPSCKIQNEKKAIPEGYSTRYKMEFEQASQDFWKNYPDAFAKYNVGVVVANFGSDRFDVDDFFKRLSNMIRESITAVLATNGYTAESLKEHFTTVDSLLKMMSSEIKKTDTEKKIKPNELASFLHGFVNTYVKNMVKEKKNG